MALQPSFYGTECCGAAQGRGDSKYVDCSMSKKTKLGRREGKRAAHKCSDKVLVNAKESARVSYLDV